MESAAGGEFRESLVIISKIMDKYSSICNIPTAGDMNALLHRD